MRRINLFNQAQSCGPFFGAGPSRNLRSCVVKTGEFILGIAATVAVAGAAAAQPKQAPSSAAPLLRSAFLATMDSEYRKLDTNGNGSVTKAELEAHQRKLAEAAATQRAATEFASIDTDRNGQLSQDEYIKAHIRIAKPAAAVGVLSRLDGNRDGSVTLVEYRTLTLATFDRLDTDKDGVLSAAEQRAGGFVR